VLSLREDVWENGQIVRSIPDRAKVRITQILYFETLEEMLSSIDFTKAIPDAASPEEALAAYRKFYTENDEAEFGVMAISFDLM